MLLLVISFKVVYLKFVRFGFYDFSSSVIMLYEKNNLYSFFHSKFISYEEILSYICLPFAFVIVREVSSG